LRQTPVGDGIALSTPGKLDVTVEDGGESAWAKFGNRTVPRAGTVSGRLFVDAEDAAEFGRPGGVFGLGGQELELYLDPRINSAIEVVRTVTAADGSFTFTSVPAGEHYLRWGPNNTASDVGFAEFNITVRSSEGLEDVAVQAFPFIPPAPDLWSLHRPYLAGETAAALPAGATFAVYRQLPGQRVERVALINAMAGDVPGIDFGGGTWFVEMWLGGDRPSHQMVAYQPVLNASGTVTASTYKVELS
jgi:hypothetical protein